MLKTTGTSHTLEPKQNQLVKLKRTGDGKQISGERSREEGLAERCNHQMTRRILDRVGNRNHTVTRATLPAVRTVRPLPLPFEPKTREPESPGGGDRNVSTSAQVDENEYIVQSWEEMQEANARLI
jgi:hypothetical protein